MVHKIFSFFSGLGFLDLGFEASKENEIKFINEIHRPFADAYRYSRQAMGLSEAEYGICFKGVEELVAEPESLQKLIADTSGNGSYTGFIGGPPCPDFSVGGKNRGRQGDKGALSEAYINLITQHCPDYFLFENVKGLWRTKKHREFYEELKRTLFAANYIVTEKIVNAIEYGVAQDRDRIILIGFNKITLSNIGIKVAQNETYLPEGMFPWGLGKINNKSEVFALPWPTTKPFEIQDNIPKPEGIIEELTVQHWFDKNMVDRHTNATHHFQPRAGLARFLTVEEGDNSRKSFKRLHRWRYSPTAAYGNNEVHLHPYKARRISAAEALAIQSLPMEFVLPPEMSLTNMFKGIGNGVPYLLAKALSGAIHKFLDQES